jgi:hypothetical protein
MVCSFNAQDESMKHIFRLALAVGLVSVMAHTYTYAQTAEKPDVQVGDRWAWQHINGLANEKDHTKIEDVIEVTDKEIRTRIRIKGKSGSSVATYTHEWNPVDVVSARYDPNLQEFAFPLQVGKRWSGNADKLLFSSGKHGMFILKGEVVALEKVTVPAGTFDAYKVNVVLEATGTDEDANIGNTIETYWYAPSVKRHVKYENTFTRDGRVRSKDMFELLDFSLR